MNRQTTIALAMIVLSLMAAWDAFAQQPRNIPQPNGDPVLLDNWTNVILYVILPIMAIVFYIIWWRTKRNNGNDD